MKVTINPSRDNPEIFQLSTWEVSGEPSRISFECNQRSYSFIIQEGQPVQVEVYSLKENGEIYSEVGRFTLPSELK